MSARLGLSPTKEMKKKKRYVAGPTLWQTIPSPSQALTIAPANSDGVAVLRQPYLVHTPACL